jgi:hypothetical protein
MMKFFAGLIGFLLGVALIGAGIYIGLYLFLIGGICDIINQLKAQTTEPSIVAIAIVKILFFEIPLIIGIYSGMTLAVLSGAVMVDAD